MGNWVINYLDKEERYQSYECFADSVEDAFNHLIQSKEIMKVSLITEIFMCDEEEN